MKKKAKRYQEGGVLRDRYGNPVKSGSGETVRTGYPERSYNEQSTADMTESSDYRGRRRKSPESSAADADSDSTYMPSGRTPNIGYGGGKESSEESDKSEGPTAKTFKQAFADARRSGDKTFEFGGKKYTTDIAKPKASKAAAPDESAAETARLRRVPQASKEEMDRRSRAEREQALETSSPESSLIGGGGLRLMKALAERLAGRQAAKEAGKAMGRRMEKDITPRPAQLTNEPLKIGRESLKLGMKKGGAVKKYSSGGSVSSASKRADGIATKGKTRGRIC
jgi:phosphopantetheinyl transferase (holo-ACP synthase)